MTRLNTSILVPQERAVQGSRSLFAATQVFTDSGSADMGSLTYGLTIGSPPAAAADTNASTRFPNGDARFIPMFVRVHFVAGTGTADLSINIDSGDGSRFDMVLHTVEARGTGADVNWRLCPDELHNWILEPMDRLVLTWTNPDSGNMLWGAKVGLLMLDENA